MRPSKIMSHDFSNVPELERPRSVFKRNHDRHQTMNAGDLVPLFVDEILPGDTATLKQQLLVRQQTPLAPFMDNIYVDTHYFFVPCRLLWDNWVKFQGEQDNPGDSTSFTIPTITSPAGGFGSKSLYDYMGIQPRLAGSNTITVNALPLRAYNLIYNQWYRDENLQPAVPFTRNDGPDTAANYVIRKRGKRHDYFTSCLPAAQKGAAVSIPLGTSAPVNRVSNAVGWGGFNSGGNVAVSAGQNVTTAAAGLITNSASPAGGISLDPRGGLVADLSAATAATINSLRQAFAIQQILELDARGGTRYVEALKARWGVTSPDFRLQRPEFIGGSSMPINVHQVPQTSAVTGQPTPQGNLAAFAIGSKGDDVFTYSATEHGYILGIVSVRADLRYQQGLPKLWSRRTRYDFYEPALANLGEQAVLNSEIYCDGSANDGNVFGYQERFAEYRYKNSEVCGEFRSSFTTPLDMWHLAQNFTSLPALDSTFIQENPPIARISAVTTQDYFRMDAYFDYTHARVMPIHGVPGLKRL